MIMQFDMRPLADDCCPPTTVCRPSPRSAFKGNYNIALDPRGIYSSPSKPRTDLPPDAARWQYTPRPLDSVL